MANLLGLTQEGLETALRVKEDYKNGEPICVPGEDTRILMPEHLMNHHLDLRGFDDPLPLAMMATRDPESPMALAAVTRLTPLCRKSRLVSGVFQVVAETTRHPLVRECMALVTDGAFGPDAIAQIRQQASRFILRSRQEYTAALRQNLHLMLEGTIAPRQFVKEFFELTEAGNMRHDIRKKLVLSLLLAETVRPSVKFLMLENYHRLPKPVRVAIISAVLKAEPTHHVEIIKEELKWIVMQDRVGRGVH